MWEEVGESWGVLVWSMVWLSVAETGGGVVVDLLGAGLELKEVRSWYRDLELGMGCGRCIGRGTVKCPARRQSGRYDGFNKGR